MPVAAAWHLLPCLLPTSPPLFPYSRTFYLPGVVLASVTACCASLPWHFSLRSHAAAALAGSLRQLSEVGGDLRSGASFATLSGAVCSLRSRNILLLLRYFRAALALHGAGAGIRCAPRGLCCLCPSFPAAWRTCSPCTWREYANWALRCGGLAAPLRTAPAGTTARRTFRGKKKKKKKKKKKNRHGHPSFCYLNLL